MTFPLLTYYISSAKLRFLITLRNLIRVSGRTVARDLPQAHRAAGAGRLETGLSAPFDCRVAPRPSFCAQLLIIVKTQIYNALYTTVLRLPTRASLRCQLRLCCHPGDKHPKS